MGEIFKDESKEFIVKLRRSKHEMTELHGKLGYNCDQQGVSFVQL